MKQIVIFCEYRARRGTGGIICPGGIWTCTNPGGHCSCVNTCGISIVKGNKNDREKAALQSDRRVQKPEMQRQGIYC